MDEKVMDAFVQRMLALSKGMKQSMTGKSNEEIANTLNDLFAKDQKDRRTQKNYRNVLDKGSNNLPSL
jgi:uncharacterized protein with von Willebrand factor type A (vWA) domain